MYLCHLVSYLNTSKRLCIPSSCPVVSYLSTFKRLYIPVSCRVCVSVSYPYFQIDVVPSCKMQYSAYRFFNNERLYLISLSYTVRICVCVVSCLCERIPPLLIDVVPLCKMQYPVLWFPNNEHLYVINYLKQKRLLLISMVLWPYLSTTLIIILGIYFSGNWCIPRPFSSINIEHQCYKILDL